MCRVPKKPMMNRARAKAATVRISFFRCSGFSLLGAWKNSHARKARRSTSPAPMPMRARGVKYTSAMVSPDARMAKSRAEKGIARKARVEMFTIPKASHTRVMRML